MRLRVEQFGSLIKRRIRFSARRTPVTLVFRPLRRQDFLTNLVLVTFVVGPNSG